MNLSLTDVFRIDFRTSAEADALNTTLQKSLKLDYRYQPARLGLALSLADSSLPAQAIDLVGKPIRGETLFGQEEGELALWVALIFEHAACLSPTKKELADLVASHWQRGVKLLNQRWSQTDSDCHAFLIALANGDIIKDKVWG